jgi:hypothetical protein
VVVVEAGQLDWLLALEETVALVVDMDAEEVEEEAHSQQEPLEMAAQGLVDLQSSQPISNHAIRSN